MCPVDSPLRKAEYFDLRRENPVPRQTSFISDHVKSMDLCYHPERQAIHGVAAWYVLPTFLCTELTRVYWNQPGQDRDQLYYSLFFPLRSPLSTTTFFFQRSSNGTVR